MIKSLRKFYLKLNISGHCNILQRTAARGVSINQRTGFPAHLIIGIPLLPLYPCDPMFQDTAFSIVFVSMEPSIWRFDVQPILGVMVSLFECIFTHP